MVRNLRAAYMWFQLTASNEVVLKMSAMAAVLQKGDWTWEFTCQAIHILRQEDSVLYCWWVEPVITEWASSVGIMAASFLHSMQHKRESRTKCMTSSMTVSEVTNVPSLLWSLSPQQPGFSVGMHYIEIWLPGGGAFVVLPWGCLSHSTLWPSMVHPSQCKAHLPILRPPKVPFHCSIR